MSKHRSVNDGDWICSDADCSNVNFAWRPKCNKCGRDKGKVETFKKTGSEIGKKAAEKSGGLFSADDWHCSSCGNVNWARRTDCNICHTPKFGTVEPRTGLGGGYNERENVEYIERAESDDEFDDFGRRKKKFRQNPKDNDMQGRINEIRDMEKNTNEKEDSGEEMDLSKYDVVDGGPGEIEDEEDDDEEDDDDVDLSKYDFGDDSPATEKPLEAKQKELKTWPHSPSKNNHNNSSSPQRKSCSRSRSGDRKKYRSRSRDRSWSPVRKQRSYRSRSRSRSRDRDKGSSYGRSRRSRSRSRDRRPSRRSRSRERDRRRSARSRSRDRYR